METTYQNNRSRDASETTAKSARWHPLETQLRNLMLNVAQGDSRACSALFRAITPILTSFYGRRLTGRVADIDDLVQETLMAIHKRQSSYDQQRLFTPWLFAIARHKLVDFFRAGRAYRTEEELEENLQDEWFEAATDARIDVDRLLRRLPSKQARVISQTRLRGLSISEAAIVDGIGESDVKVSVHRGIKALARELAMEPA